jgi:hypothetical protein
MYYNAALEVEMLSVNDLDELERWLRGELKPATQGERSPGTALTRGVRSLVVRLLGSENRSYEVRSGTFRVESGNGDDQDKTEKKEGGIERD